MHTINLKSISTLLFVLASLGFIFAVYLGVKGEYSDTPGIGLLLVIVNIAFIIIGVQIKKR
ncbi:MAG: hypothetical protein LBS33_03615 [Streptococcaceae bacterium]|jgi:hypothetical protein|nr:hypothetical protein [Streptococcaceae bacterium]